MKKISFAFFLVLILSGCGNQATTTDEAETATTNETQIKPRESSLSAALSSWCARESCVASGEVIPIDTCRELSGGGKTYVLNQDLETAGSLDPNAWGCFVMKEPGVKLDCQGHTIRYTGSAWKKEGVTLLANGVRIFESNVTVKNCRTEGFADGIAANAWGSNKHLVNLLIENNVSVQNKQDGIYLQGIENSMIRKNILTKNQSGIYLYDGDVGVVISDNISCNHAIGDFRCLGAMPEGEGNISDDVRVCENEKPLFSPCLNP